MDTNPFKKIVKNATTTSKKWEDATTDSEMKARACPMCGAPRPADTNIAICAYCSKKFMDVEVHVNKKP